MRKSVKSFFPSLLYNHVCELALFVFAYDSFLLVLSELQTLGWIECEMRFVHTASLVQRQPRCTFRRQRNMWRKGKIFHQWG